MEQKRKRGPREDGRLTACMKGPSVPMLRRIWGTMGKWIYRVTERQGIAAWCVSPRLEESGGRWTCTAFIRMRQRACGGQGVSNGKARGRPGSGGRGLRAHRWGSREADRTIGEGNMRWGHVASSRSGRGQVPSACAEVTRRLLALRRARTSVRVVQRESRTRE